MAWWRRFLWGMMRPHCALQHRPNKISQQLGTVGGCVCMRVCAASGHARRCITSCWCLHACMLEQGGTYIGHRRPPGWVEAHHGPTAARLFHPHRGGPHRQAQRRCIVACRARTTRAQQQSCERIARYFLVRHGRPSDARIGEARHFAVQRHELRVQCQSPPSSEIRRQQVHRPTLASDAAR